MTQTYQRCRTDFLAPSPAGQNVLLLWNGDNVWPCVKNRSLSFLWTQIIDWEQQIQREGGSQFSPGNTGQLDVEPCSPFKQLNKTSVWFWRLWSCFWQWSFRPSEKHLMSHFQHHPTKKRKKQPIRRLWQCLFAQLFSNIKVKLGQQIPSLNAKDQTREERKSQQARSCTDSGFKLSGGCRIHSCSLYDWFPETSSKLPQILDCSNRLFVSTGLRRTFSFFTDGPVAQNSCCSF